MHDTSSAPFRTESIIQDSPTKSNFTWSRLRRAGKFSLRIDKTYTTRVLEYMIKGVSRVLLREGQTNPGGGDVFASNVLLAALKFEKGIIDCPPAHCQSMPDQLQASSTIPLTDRWACP